MIHGHQADPKCNGEIAAVSKFFVHNFWAEFQRLGAKDPTRAATNPGLCNEVDARLHEWAIPLLQPCHGACISPCRAQANATPSTSSAPWTGMSLAFPRTAFYSPRTPQGDNPDHPPLLEVGRGARQAPDGCLSRPLQFLSF